MSNHERLTFMAAYDRREYAKMGGAAAFYAAKRPPGYEKVLVDLLNHAVTSR